MRPLSYGDYRKIIRWYQDETGILELKWAEVAEWAKRKGVRLPVPPTPLELMARKLAAVARAERRNQEGSGADYRGMLAYSKVRQDGQIEFVWFDVDGPAATIENMQRATSLRREQMINDGVQLLASERRWNMRHPGADRLATDLDLHDEANWRLNSKDADDDIEKAG